MSGVTILLISSSVDFWRAGSPGTPTWQVTDTYQMKISDERVEFAPTEIPRAIILLLLYATTFSNHG